MDLETAPIMTSKSGGVPVLEHPDRIDPWIAASADIPADATLAELQEMPDEMLRRVVVEILMSDDDSGDAAGWLVTRNGWRLSGR